jgi:hypothetical protein
LHDVVLDLEMLQSKLRVALETANSRFKLANKGKLPRDSRNKKMIDWLLGEHKKGDLIEETKICRVSLNQNGSQNPKGFVIQVKQSSQKTL